MRVWWIWILLLLVRAALAEVPFDYPIASPQKAEVEAVFVKTEYPDSKSEGTKLVVRDRKEKVLFERELKRDVASGARWTEDGKFLIITGLNGGRHHPWHQHVYVFSLAALDILQLCDS